MARTAEEFVFFWKPEQPYGWASQWYHSPFSARITLPDGDEQEVVFPTAEHWMMGQKALLFGDQDVFQRIVGLAHSSKPRSNSATASDAASTSSAPTTNDGGPGPIRHTRSRPSKDADAQQLQANAKAAFRAPNAKGVKALGRKVQGFDEETWVRERERIVREGSLLKFRQHAELGRELLATGERELVEASPLDRIWGIGMGAGKAGETCESEEGREGWGLNLLGRALMEVRDVLRREELSPNQGSSEEGEPRTDGADTSPS